MNDEPLCEASDNALGFLADPLSNWPNDDLLLDERTREYFLKHHAAAFPILDWPRLRDLFNRHEDLANSYRDRSRRSGMIAVAATTVGLLITAFSPVLNAVLPSFDWLIGISATLFIVIGSGLALEYLIRGNMKYRWLANRLWTERTRQFYFQYLIQNLDVAAKAMNDPEALTALVRDRDSKLAEYKKITMASIREVMDRLSKDRAARDPWLVDAWRSPPALPATSENLSELLHILQRQRFGIQKRYVGHKLAQTVNSPAWRASVTAIVSNVLTLVLPLTALAIAFCILFGHSSNDPLLLGLVAVQAAAAAIVAGIRAFDVGFRWSDDGNRYGWYLARTEELERTFLAEGVEGKIEALRQMERASYEELRLFLQAQNSAHFLI